MRGTPVRFVDFRGGLNTKAQPYLVANNECRDCRNVVSTVRGSVRKRNGCTSFASAFSGSPTLTSLFPMETSNVLVVTGGTHMYSVSSGGASSVITGSATLTSNARWEFVEAPAISGQGPLYGMNGTDTPKHWAGTGTIADWTATSGSVPNGKYCIYFGNRVWAAGVSSNPSRLYFSNIGNPRDWPVENVVDFDPNDGDEITGLGTIGPYLLVFKRQKSFIVYDLDTGANRPLSVSVGCAAHRSIVETPYGTFFLSHEGVFRYTGTKLELVSDKISPTLDLIVDGQRSKACGGFSDDHYYLAICTAGTTNNLTLDYDTQIESWWVHTNTANQFCLFEAGSTAELYAVHSDGPVLDRCYVEGAVADNDENFEAYWTGPWIAFGEPYRRKRVREVRIDGKGTFDTYLATDFNESSILLRQNTFVATSGSTFGGAGTFGGEGIFGDIPIVNQAKIPSLGVARAFSLTFKQSDHVDPAELEIDSFSLLYNLRND